jgi:protein NrfD
MATPEWVVWLPRGHWGLFIATYLFLGGLSGGAYLTSVVSSVVFRPRAESPEELFACEETSRWGALLAVAGIAVGGVALLSHLGAPLRALTFPVLFSNVGSWLVVGTWFIVLFSTVATLEMLWLLFGSEHDGAAGASYFPRRLLGLVDGLLPADVELLALADAVADVARPSGTVRSGVRLVGSLLGVGVIVYTAMLLSDLASVPLWNRQFLPLVFLMSGASTGISAALFGTVLSGGGLSRTNHLFCLTDDGLIVLEVAFIAGLLSYLHSAGGVAARASLEKLFGPLGPHFVVGVLALGLVLPFLISMTLMLLTTFTEFEETTLGAKAMTAGFATKYTLVLVGGLLLRYVVLFAAVKIPIGVA